MGVRQFGWDGTRRDSEWEGLEVVLEGGSEAVFGLDRVWVGGWIALMSGCVPGCMYSSVQTQ